MKKIVIIGGGVGAATFTRAFKDLPIKLTTIVSSFDDGGSTGLIRRDYGGIALGDFRNCLLASADWPEDLSCVFNHRFGPGHLQGANTGNILLRAFFDTAGNPQTAINRLHDFFNLKNRVIPVSFSCATLQAKLSNHKVLSGQKDIADYLSFMRAPIRKISLSKQAVINPQAKSAIMEADLLIFAPGHFFTSLMPHLSVTGFARAWKKSKAKKVWTVNLLAHKGQDSYYSLIDYLKWFQEALGSKPFDLIVINKTIKPSLLRQVADRFEPVTLKGRDIKALKQFGIRLAREDLAGGKIRKQHPNDLIKRAPLRHDEKKIKNYFQRHILK